MASKITKAALDLERADGTSVGVFPTASGGFGWMAFSDHEHVTGTCKTYVAAFRSAMRACDQLAGKGHKQ